MSSLNSKDDVLKRLRRVEGQVRGVAKMVEDDRACTEILQQLAAIRSAVQQVNVLVARTYACECLNQTDDGQDAEQLVDNLISVLSKTG